MVPASLGFCELAVASADAAQQGQEFLDMETAPGGCYILSEPENDGTRTLEWRE